MPKARIQDKTLKNMMRDEAEQAIDLANLGTEDTKIARMYLIDKTPQIDIAIEMDCERSTISRRLKQIESRVKHTRRRLKKESDNMKKTS